MDRISASDLESIRNGLEDANIPTLLMVLTQLSGDLRWIEPPYQPTRTRGLDDHDSGGLSAAVQEEIRAAAFAAISEWSRGREVGLRHPSAELVTQMMSVCMGTEVPPEFGALLHAELESALDAGEPVPTPLSEPDDIGPENHAIILGAGASGLAAAISLRKLGITYSIYEKNDNVGGSWYANDYPGAGVDTPNHLYALSFAPADWKHYFATRDEIQEYLESIAETHSIYPNISLQSEIIAARFLANEQLWAVDVRDGSGKVTTHKARYFITAMGAFSRPIRPNIPGLQEFEGDVFHTAQWPKSADLRGKRVAVIGTGASSMQVVASIPDLAESVTVFQRSAQWVAPFDKFRKEVPGDVRTLIREVPLYRAWYRLRQNWTFTDNIHASLQKDPDWPHSERSLNAINDGHRRYFQRYMEKSLAGRPDLIEKSLPTYPPFGKRILLDNGWFKALVKPNVHLVTESVERITSTGIVSASGEESEFDVIVLATGFDVVRFLAPVEIVGREGAVLSEVWDGDDPRAYLGMMVPQFPNLFCLYGPNTQTAGGSLLFVIESQIHYMTNLLVKLQKEGLVTAEPTAEVFSNYNQRVDIANENMIWTHSGMETYYRNARGRVVVVNPFRAVDFWAMTREADLSEFKCEPQVELASKPNS